LNASKYSFKSITPHLQRAAVQSSTYRHLLGSHPQKYPLCQQQNVVINPSDPQPFIQAPGLCLVFGFTVMIIPRSSATERVHA
jgi:hypothetical protein